MQYGAALVPASHRRSRPPHEVPLPTLRRHHPFSLSTSRESLAPRRTAEGTQRWRHSDRVLITRQETPRDANSRSARWSLSTLAGYDCGRSLCCVVRPASIARAQTADCRRASLGNAKRPPFFFFVSSKPEFPLPNRVPTGEMEVNREMHDRFFHCPLAIARKAVELRSARGLRAYGTQRKRTQSLSRALKLPHYAGTSVVRVQEIQMRTCDRLPTSGSGWDPVLQRTYAKFLQKVPQPALKRHLSLHKDVIVGCRPVRPGGKWRTSSPLVASAGSHLPVRADHQQKSNRTHAFESDDALQGAPGFKSSESCDSARPFPFFSLSHPALFLSSLRT